MKMETRTRLNVLFDLYSALLTDRQRELFDAHYQYDLSLGEIAENISTSRQAVFDLLRRTSAQLESYEKKLALLSKHLLRQQLLEQLETRVGHHPGVIELLEQLKNS